MTMHLTETQLNDAADGVAADAEGAAHLRECDDCRAAVGRIRTLTAGLAALPRHGEPGSDLWPAVAARTVHERPGVILLPSFVRSGRRPAAAGWWRAAAAVVLFAAGAGVGRVTASNSSMVPPTGSQASADPVEAAARVQRAGTEYVAAVAAFAALGSTANERELAQGRDAAFAAMYGAAKELTRLTTPADSSADQIYRAVSQTRQLTGETVPGVRF